MYRVIDDYYRQPIFDFYRASRNPFYSLTFELDAAPLKRWAAERDHPVYLNLCYFFSRAMQPLADFRYRLVDGEIVLYDRIHPAMTVPAADGLFSFFHQDYDEDIERFNESAQRAMPSPQDPADLATMEHTNYIFFTAIPGVPFTSFTHASAEPTDGAPRVAFGKWIADGAALRLPVGIQINHLFVDGRALGDLYDRAREVFANPG